MKLAVWIWTIVTLGENDLEQRVLHCNIYSGDKGQLEAGPGERVCEAESFTLCPFGRTISEQSYSPLFQNKFPMKYWLIYQLLLISHRHEFLHRTITSLTATLWAWTARCAGQAACNAEEHAVSHNILCLCANAELTAEDSLHAFQPANAPALCCQWKIPLQIPHTAKSYRGQIESQGKLTSYQHGTVKTQ